MGVTFGGPIVKDKLFFFASYEEQEITDFGGASQSDGVSNGFVTSQEVQDAMDIAAGLGMQPGNYGSTGVNLENKRTLVKLAWNISDYHRASLTYHETKEFLPSPYDAFPEKEMLSRHWNTIDNTPPKNSLPLLRDYTE